MISISVDMPENAQEKKINSTLAIRSLEAIMSIKIEGQTDANQTLLSLSTKAGRFLVKKTCCRDLKAACMELWSSWLGRGI